MEATLASIVAVATPLIFAVVGETITERAGVVNLSLEGSIMLSALAAFAATYESGSVLVGFAAAMAVSMVIASIIAFSSIRLRVNQIAIGFVLTLLALSLALFLGNSYVGVASPGVRHLAIPGLSRIPVVGPILFDHNLAVYGSYVAIVAAYLFLYRTRWGLSLSGVGERPAAAFARGIPVNRVRFLATVVGGALVGMAGASFSLYVKLGWREGLTSNYGWIALAIVIFGGWNPVRAALGAYFFGALQIVALKLQPHFPGLSQILPLLPFPLMIFTLVFVQLAWFRRAADRYPSFRRILASDPPGALGTAFRRE
jgi:general nucleoside transport system permease protein